MAIDIKISGKKFSADQRSMMLRMLNLNEKDLIKGLGVFLNFQTSDTRTVLRQK